MPLKERLLNGTRLEVILAQSEDDDEAFALIDTPSAASFYNSAAEMCRPGL